MKRRNLLKMLGVSPALLVPWKPATEQIVAPPPSPVEPEKLTLEEALKRVDWGAMKFAQVTSPSASIGYSTWGHRHRVVDGLVMGDDDGPV